MPPIVVSITSSHGKSKAAGTPPMPAVGDALAVKPGQIAPQPIATVAPTLAGAAAIRPTAFSSTKLAANPPATFATRRLDVPTPRPRPHHRAKKRH
jgi:hypothetical protein